MGKIISLFFAAASLMILWGIAFQYRMSNRMIPIEGNLIDIDVKLGFEWDETASSGRSYIVEPKYQYIVIGKMYEGHNVRVDGRKYFFKSNADAVVNSLKGRKTITVWYDPLNPKYSILIKPAIQIRAVIALCVTLFLMIWFYKYFDDKMRKFDRYLKEKGVIPVRKKTDTIFLLLLIMFTSVAARADDLVKLQERHVISAGTDYKISSGKYNIPIAVSFIDKEAAKYDTPENAAIETQGQPPV